MRPLILDEEAKSDIQKVINFAEAQNTSKLISKLRRGYPPVGIMAHILVNCPLDLE